MAKTRIESTWHFGAFTVINSRYRNQSGTTEQSEIFKDGAYTRLHIWGYGKYHWINRPWQRYDYESSFRNAYRDLLESITWRQYEENLKDIKAMHDAIVKMENYGGTPRN